MVVPLKTREEAIAQLKRPGSDLNKGKGVESFRCHTFLCSAIQCVIGISHGCLL